MVNLTERELMFQKFMRNRSDFTGEWTWPRTEDNYCFVSGLTEYEYTLWQAFNDGIELRDKSDRENKIASSVNGVERLSVFRNKRGQLEPSVGGIRIGNVSGLTVQCDASGQSDASGQTTATIICTNVEIEPG